MEKGKCCWIRSGSDTISFPSPCDTGKFKSKFPNGCAFNLAMHRRDIRHFTSLVFWLSSIFYSDGMHPLAVGHTKTFFDVVCSIQLSWTIVFRHISNHLSLFWLENDFASSWNIFNQTWPVPLPLERTYVHEDSAHSITENFMSVWVSLRTAVAANGKIFSQFHAGEPVHLWNGYAIEVLTYFYCWEEK